MKIKLCDVIYVINEWVFLAVVLSFSIENLSCKGFQNICQIVSKLFDTANATFPVSIWLRFNKQSHICI